MIPRITPIATDLPKWVRDVATSLNAVLKRVEEPQLNQVRYNGSLPSKLERWDGTAWVSV